MRGLGPLLFAMLVGNVGGYIVGRSSAPSQASPAPCAEPTIAELVARCKAKGAYLSISLGEPICLRGKMEELPP